jgi:hypothetical protein
MYCVVGNRDCWLSASRSNLRISCRFAARLAALTFAGIAMLDLSSYACLAETHFDNSVKLPEYGTAFKEMTRSLSQRELALIDEYRQNYARLRNLYGNVQIEAIVRSTNFPGRKTDKNPDGKNTARLHYRSKDNKLFRVDAEALDWEREESLGRHTVYVVGPEVSFEARRTGLEHSLAITRVFANSAELVNGPLLVHSKFFRAPFSTTGNAILEEMLFDRPNWPVSEWRISRVELSEDRPNLVSIFLDTVYNDERSGKLAMDYRFTFIRNLAWALESYSSEVKILQSDEDMAWLGRFQYDRGADDMPLLKNATYWVERGPDRERSQDEVYDVTRFVPEPADTADFLPEALGLSLAASKANWTGRFLIFILGVVLLIAYFNLKRRQPAS